MSTNVFGHGVCDHISTKQYGLLVDWGGESIINNQLDTSAFQGLSDSLNVKALQGWVGWGLKPADFSYTWFDAGLELFNVSEIREGQVNSRVWVQDSS